MVAVEGQREAWNAFLHRPTSGFNLPESYPLDFAVAIYLYTLNYPPIHAVINGELWNPDRRKPGTGASGGTGVNSRLSACLPYIKFLIDACQALHEEYLFKGKVWRGVEWVYQSPNNHKPKAHLPERGTLLWYEFKSTSKGREVMTRDHFCRVDAGPRTIFTMEASYAYSIEKFSFFHGVKSEHEVLILPLSKFRVKFAQRTS